MIIIVSCYIIESRGSSGAFIWIYRNIASYRCFARSLLPFIQLTYYFHLKAFQSGALAAGPSFTASTSSSIFSVSPSASTVSSTSTSQARSASVGHFIALLETHERLNLVLIFWFYFSFWSVCCYRPCGKLFCDPSINLKHSENRCIKGDRWWGWRWRRSTYGTGTFSPACLFLFSFHPSDSAYCFCVAGTPRCVRRATPIWSEARYCCFLSQTSQNRIYPWLSFAASQIHISVIFCCVCLMLIL